MTSAFPTTPVIAIDGLFDPSGANTADLDAAIAAALRDDGSFVATGFPGSAGFDRRALRMLRFFDLPMAEKMALAPRHSRPGAANIYRGYNPLPAKRGWSCNENYDIGPRTPTASGHPDLVEAFREASVWPDREPCPGWRDDMRGYYDDLRALSVAVLRAVARGLGRDEATIVASCAGDNGTLRMLHYPPAPDDFIAADHDEEPVFVDEAGRRIVTHSHVDTCTMSLLWQDEVGGLQTCTPAGEWREVPAIPDGISIHNGDLMAGLTGGACRGTFHRVVGYGRDRCSIGMFLEPEFDAEVLPPKGGRPVTYARHLIDEFPTRF